MGDRTGLRFRFRVGIARVDCVGGIGGEGPVELIIYPSVKIYIKVVKKCKGMDGFYRIDRVSMGCSGH